MVEISYVEINVIFLLLLFDLFNMFRLTYRFLKFSAKISLTQQFCSNKSLKFAISLKPKSQQSCTAKHLQPKDELDCHLLDSQFGNSITKL